MPNSHNEEHLKLWTPATYRIEVEGEVPESWSDRLGGMRITTRQRKNQSTVTTLTGRVRDQAELTGVLNTLYELHLPILSVKILAEDNDAQKDPDKPAERQGKEVTT
jgi:hypothetical protein